MAMILSKVTPFDFAATKATARAGRSFFSRLLEAILNRTGARNTARSRAISI